MKCSATDCTNIAATGQPRCSSHNYRVDAISTRPTPASHFVDQNKQDIGASDLAREVRLGDGAPSVSRVLKPVETAVDGMTGSMLHIEEATETAHISRELNKQLESLGVVTRRDIVSEGAETKEVLAGGATRTKSQYRFDLIPVEAELREALRFGQGALKHGENNWRKGNWQFVVSCVGHIKAHVANMVVQGNTTDDNIGAIRWNAAAIAWYEEYKPREFNQAMEYLRTGARTVMGAPIVGK